MIEFVFRDLSAERVAVNAKNFRGARLIAIGALEDALYKTFFEFPDSLIEEDSAFDHQGYKAFQLISHGHAPQQNGNLENWPDC